MKKLIALISIVILAVIFVPVGLTQQKSEDAPSTQPTSEAPPFRPKYDREIFQKSGTSIARGDLLGCRNDDAQVTDGSDVDVDEFARMLHGVWVNQNARTLHGITIETDNAFYINMRGRRGVAIMIDRNNLGDFSLTKPYLTPGSGLRIVSRPLTMTWVNCTYDFVDRYIKVSDEVPIEVLGSSTHVKLGKNIPLEQAWNQIVASGYFDSFEMATQNRDPGSPRRTVNFARLGDGQRMAIQLDGLKVDEQGIRDGLAPGAEYCLPMMVGGFFRITLTPKAEGRRNVGVHMRFDAEYRAVGIGIKPGEPLIGVEDGIFAKEGSSYVSADRVELGADGTPRKMFDSWISEEGGDKNKLVAPPATVVNAPRRDREHFVEGHALYFERVVIGAPGQDVLEQRGKVSSTKTTAPPAKARRQQHK